MEDRSGWLPPSSEQTKKLSRTDRLKRLFSMKGDIPDIASAHHGETDIKDIIVPSSADFTAKDYIIVDGMYHTYLYITGYGYSTTVSIGWLSPLIEAGEGINISFSFERQPKDKTISKISQATMINRSRMREVGDTRSDYEELGSAISAGLYLKEGMNKYNEDFYYIHTSIEITAEDLDTLERRVSFVHNLCVSQDMFCKRADYKHKESFISTLPLLQMDEDIERKSKRNALTSSVAAAFPFSSYEICDQKGVFFGINQHNRSPCIVDIFDSSKYSNANISIMGMSGAGKTFALQSLALRFREQGIPVYIIAPLKGYEFIKGCEAVGGKYIKLSPSSADCINPLEIRRHTLDTDHEIGSYREDSLLADKLQKARIYYSLGKASMTEEENHYLDTALVECFEKLGMSYDNKTLYADYDRRIFKEMPTQQDIYEILSQREETKNLALSVSRYVTGSARNMGGHTNVDLSNDYTVIDISELPKDLLSQGMYTALDFCSDRIKNSRVQKKVVIIDEAWVVMGASSNTLAAEFVLEEFKTIRGFGGSAICATQDLNDFFALENGKYGKGILNNSRIKIILPLEEEEAVRVKEVMGLSDEEFLQITRNGRGVGLLCAGRNRINVTFHASEREKYCITTNREELAKRIQRSNSNA